MKIYIIQNNLNSKNTNKHRIDELSKKIDNLTKILIVTKNIGNP